MPAIINLRCELHPPGATAAQRGNMPLASATFSLVAGTATDPNALPTVRSMVQGGLTGRCVSLLSLSDGGIEGDDIWCSVGRSPDATVEPRHRLSFGGADGTSVIAIPVGDTDRLQFLLA